MRIDSRRLHHRLPVFAVRVDGRDLVYAPGMSVAVEPQAVAQLEAALADQGRRQPLPADDAATGLAGLLQARASDALAQWQHLAQAGDDWRCLTLYPSNRCGLGCEYCFAAPSRVARAPQLDERVVAAAAAEVARRVAAAGEPLTVAFHGGGEPTADWPLLQRLVACTRAVAREHGVAWWGYIATHGVLGAERARWLAGEFDALGLSCDGPPELHDRRRPTRRGGPTAAAVARTAALLRQAGKPFSVRVTVGPDEVERQPDIVRWLHDELAPQRVAIEPVYRAAAAAAFAPGQAEAFAQAFWQAREWGRDHGLAVDTSSVRIDEVHGPFCNPLRGVLQLCADHRAHGCFLSTGSGAADEESLAVAAFDAATAAQPGSGAAAGAPVVFDRRSAALCARALQRPERCRHCFNALHCAGDCPDRCPAIGNDDDQPGFRCRLARALGARAIVERAEPAPAAEA